MIIEIKILKNIKANQVQQYIKDKHHEQVGFIQGIQDWVNI